MRLGLTSPVPGYVSHAPYPFLNGMGDLSTDQQITGMATSLATTTVGILGALHTVIAGVAFAGPAGPLIAGAIAGLAALATVLEKEFSGCGQTCIVASNNANKYEPYLVQNLSQYLASPIHYASLQQAALNNFDTIWNALRTACSDPALAQAGQRCISDRQSGACQWKSSTYGWTQDSTGKWTFTTSGPAGSGTQCWNWVDYYRGAIANDPTVVPDPTPGSTVGSTVTGTNGQPIQVGSGGGFKYPHALTNRRSGTVGLCPTEMNLSLPTSRGRFGRFGYRVPLSGGVQGLGACSSMPGSTFCLDQNTGSVVNCTDKVCQSPGQSPVPGGGWSTNAPPQANDPTYANIPIGGFTGDFQVETLDSYLAGRLAAKESPFVANAIARGADSVDAEAQDFLPTAQSYCSINSALPDCSPASQAQLAAKYAGMLRAWGAGQRASTYQAGDSGTLGSPVNTLTNTAPQYTPPPVVNPVNVLNPAGTGNPLTGNQNVTGQQEQGQGQQTTDIAAWLKDNWWIVALGVGAVVLLPAMMKGK